MKRYALTMLMLAMISTSTACIIAQPEPGETEEWEVGENNNLRREGIPMVEESSYSCKKCEVQEVQEKMVNVVMALLHMQ